MKVTILIVLIILVKKLYNYNFIKDLSLAHLLLDKLELMNVPVKDSLFD